MSLIGLRDLTKLCYDKGWRGLALAQAPAVSYGEARGPGWTVDTQAVHANPNGSIDRGMWAFNDKAHPDISDAVAFDPDRATARARIMYLDQGWSPWVAFEGESYWLAYNGANTPLLARQWLELPGFGALPEPYRSKGYVRQWVAEDVNHWCYQLRGPHGEVLHRITAPASPALSGFTAWDDATQRWTYVAAPLT